MTNEELDKARATEARRLGNYDIVQAAARLAREGWAPPAAVDPDLLEARKIVAQIYDVSWPERAGAIRRGGQDNNVENVSALEAIKRGRALAAAEAKPGVVWVKHDGSDECPVDRKALVILFYHGGGPMLRTADVSAWKCVTHYAVITPPEDVA